MKSATRIFSYHSEIPIAKYGSPVDPNNIQHEEDKEMQLRGILQGSLGSQGTRKFQAFWIQNGEMGSPYSNDLISE